VLDARRRFLGTLQNSYKFFAEYARIDGFDPRSSEVPEVAKRPEIDRWLCSRTQSLVGEVRARMDEFDLSNACRAIEAFVTGELSNWYIRRNRRRFWKGENGADKLGAYASLHEALSTVALLMAPVAPFLSEVLWERLQADGSSVHLQLMPQANSTLIDSQLEQSMQLVERVVEMGRALRERSGLRVRQPLRALHLRATEQSALDLLATGFASHQILDELNIKGWGSLATDDGQLCTLKAKANFKTLGKRLGKSMKAAAALIAEFTSEQVALCRSGASVPIDLDGEAIEIGPEDVLVSVETNAEFDVETDGRIVLFLDTELDDDLLTEGLAREVISRVNTLRKESGLAVEERIVLRLAGNSPLLQRAFVEFKSLISEETLTEDFEMGDQPLPGSDWTTIELSAEHSLQLCLKAC
ncbi:MAG: isoleucyl-tRNA synthetase, partial [Candidatus Paceibacteria bacterium]